MNVTINGKAEQVQSGTVLDLLKAKHIEPQMVAVEVNDKMLERGAPRDDQTYRMATRSSSCFIWVVVSDDARSSCL